MTEYERFLQAKTCLDGEHGFEVEAGEVHSMLYPHQREIVRWMVRGGRRACFAAFGLGKSVIQLEAVRLTRERAGGMGLIVIPLGVRQEFRRDAEMLGLSIRFVRRLDECTDPSGIYMTNYETIRDQKLDPTAFSVVSLDEASCLRGFGGTKTFRQFMAYFEGSGRYRYVATATPSPNDYIELLAYSAFLDVMDVGQAKTRFFRRNSEKADQLTIHPHKEREFWLWVASWGLFVQRPSDLGYSDEGYEMPAIDLRLHRLAVDHRTAEADKHGQGQLFREATSGVVSAAREKRETLPARVARLVEIVDAAPDDHWLLWHDLEAERRAIEVALPEAVSVYGSQDLEDRERAIIDFSEGRIRLLAAKPCIAGSGCNFQRHCHKAVFLGIGFKFNDFVQAIHRIQRFLQTETVEIHVIYAESEDAVWKTLERKWMRHKEMVSKMSEIIREYGLAAASMARELTRRMGIERAEAVGEGYRLVNWDCVLETERMEEASVDLIVTSIPFSTQYEYSPNYADFGHTDDNPHFWEQMGFLIPNLLRVLRPGRICAIHVKDRIIPSGMTGLGFQTVYPFHVDAIQAFVRAGFGYLGMKTIVTDVVRENAQTYRLGWTEQCKDGTKMGVGMPEYLLIFRRPPTDTSNAYGDLPVAKPKPLSHDEHGNAVPYDQGERMIPGTGYSRSRWQIDAHGYARSSGNRLPTARDMEVLNHAAIFRLFRDYSLTEVYDYEYHVRLCEELERGHRLPTGFMLLQPQSWSPEVWSDITRMRTLNLNQSVGNRQMHLCPLQFDLVDRAIRQWSMKGETVYDPFAGLGTVPYRAVQMGRVGVGCELSPAYWVDAVMYCETAAREKAMPTLFDVLEYESEDGGETSEPPELAETSEVAG